MVKKLDILFEVIIAGAIATAAWVYYQNSRDEMLLKSYGEIVAINPMQGDTLSRYGEFVQYCKPMKKAYRMDILEEINKINLDENARYSGAKAGVKMIMPIYCQRQKDALDERIIGQDK